MRGKRSSFIRGTDLVRTGLDLAARQLWTWIAGRQLVVAGGDGDSARFFPVAQSRLASGTGRAGSGIFCSAFRQHRVFTRAETGVVTEEHTAGLTPTQSGELVAVALGGETHPAGCRGAGLFFSSTRIRQRLGPGSVEMVGPE